MVKIDTRRLLPNTGYWFGLPALITIIGFLPGNLVAHSTLLIFYLCAVLFTSMRADQISVVACALSGFLLFNYFHIQPRYSLLTQLNDEVLSAFVFVVFAVVAGGIAGKLNRQLKLLREQKEFFSTQVAFYQSIQDIKDSKDIPVLLNGLFGELFQHEVTFSLQAATDKTDKDAEVLFWESANSNSMSPDREAMLLSLKEQVQSVLHRIATAKALKEAERQSDEDKLRSTLLSSVSHDLKTPLVTMLGAATSLRDLRKDLSTQDAEDLLDSIITESQRLESYIQNLLEMTRLGHGELSLIRDWVSVEEIYHVVARRIARMVTTPRMSLELSGSVPSLFVHAALIEQGLFNVIDNALKAAGNNAEIRVDALVKARMIHIKISDQGPGLPVSEWKAVFDPFYTFSLGDCYEKGTGLGLSICRSIFRVHGGDAEITDPPAGFNHCVLLTLPLPVAPSEEEDEEHD